MYINLLMLLEEGRFEGAISKYPEYSIFLKKVCPYKVDLKKSKEQPHI